MVSGATGSAGWPSSLCPAGQGLRLWDGQGCGQAGSSCGGPGLPESPAATSLTPERPRQGPKAQHLSTSSVSPHGARSLNQSDLRANCPRLAPKPMLASGELVSVILVKS